VNGVLIPVRQPTAIASALRSLGADAELRRKMGEFGKQIARERFDEQKCVATVLATYRDVAARKQLPFD
jgi:glycosyltransferase involved in cell wall biosynthesis